MLSRYLLRSTLTALVALLAALPAAKARTLFTIDANQNRLFAFDLGSAGALSPIAGYPFFTSQQFSTVLVGGPNATRLYGVSSAAGTIATYAISSDGSLFAIGLPVAAGTTPSAAAVSPAGTLLFVANSGDDTISRFAVLSDGSLSSLGTPTPTGSGPSAIGLTPDGKHLYVANATDKTISAFTVGTSGSLDPLGTPVATGNHPAALSVRPDGTSLYGLDSSDDTVTRWSIASDGVLTQHGDPVAAGASVGGMSVAPDGSRLVVTNPLQSTVRQFSIDQQGALSADGSAVASPPQAQAVSFSPDGSRVAVAGLNAVGSYATIIGGGLTPVTSPQAAQATYVGSAFLPDQSPTAQIDPFIRAAGAETDLRGGASQDSDGTVVAWRWDFGDGTTGTGSDGAHVYAQAGSYKVTLTVTDNEGCGTSAIYTGQMPSCGGSTAATAVRTVTIPAPIDEPTPSPPCIHNGNDGFCGTPDQAPPTVSVLGFENGASITTIDAPTEIVGTITPDPSGIRQITLRFTKSNGIVVKRTTLKRRVCRTVRRERTCAKKTVYRKACNKIHGKRRCVRKPVTIVSRTPACLSISGNKNYLVRYACAKVPWTTISGDTTFRYSLPVALDVGQYHVEVIATDGAGNTDSLEVGRNDMTFKVVNTPSNQDSGGSGTPSGGTGSNPSTPITDTGSPFG